jgi:Antibiotic biosynthesis monooxygenase
VEVEAAAERGQADGGPSVAFSKAARAEIGRPVWNVRAVGFISKPQCTDELAALLESSLNDLLQDFPGFAGTLVLRSQEDKRSLLVLSFWETERQAATTGWEANWALGRVIRSMVDVCTKVQTFRASAPANIGDGGMRPATPAGKAR